MPMTLISRQTLTGTAASVTFNNIPQTFQTLKLVVSARNTYSQVTMYFGIGINGSTSNMSFRALRGSGSAVDSRSGTQEIPTQGNGGTANTFGSTEIVFPNYAGSTNKPFSIDAVTENNATSATQEIQAQLWSNAAAITSMTIQDIYYGGVNFVSGSTFSLYGLS